MKTNLSELFLDFIYNGGIGDIEAWTKLDLTMPQLKVVMLIMFHGKMTVGQLAENLDVSLPNITGIIDRLQQQGYVTRIHSEKDRRVVFIQSTEKVKGVFMELNQSSVAQIKKIEQQLTENEMEIAKLGLKVLNEAIKKAKNTN
ncbi:MarR family transcriptional regulator [Tepidibacillus marianensis]|uniref:MarR family transcriptional regulator n=1 Tax=Tepidibacillus marianensis TaxID=3131995 RepID=UPI0030D03251